MVKAPRLQRPEVIDDGPIYRGDPRIEWILDVVPSGKLLEQSAFLPLFDGDWRLDRRADVYGEGAGGWTYPGAKGTTESYSALEIGFELWSRRTNAELEALRSEVVQKLDALGSIRVAPRAPLRQALERSRELAELLDAYDEDQHDAVIILQAPSGSPFDEEQTSGLFDDLLLSPGPPDFFWANEPDAPGDDTIFRVSFVPLEEGIGAVTFGMNVPRTADPVHVYGQMLVAAQYAETVLGGVLLDGDESPLDASKDRARIAADVARLNAHDLPPGLFRTMRVF